MCPSPFKSSRYAMYSSVLNTGLSEVPVGYEELGWVKDCSCYPRVNAFIAKLAYCSKSEWLCRGWYLLRSRTLHSCWYQTMPIHLPSIIVSYFRMKKISIMTEKSNAIPILHEREVVKRWFIFLCILGSRQLTANKRDLY